jgi:hypothetical protein
MQHKAITLRSFLAYNPRARTLQEQPTPGSAKLKAEYTARQVKKQIIALILL